MPNMIHTVSDVVCENTTDDKLKDISNKCSTDLEGILINLQALGYLIYAANQSTEMNSDNNVKAGCLVEDLANEAHALYLLRIDADITLKQRQGGEQS
ncbi:MAG: hypothetical protein KZQ83_20545 [gamma proteobacterium symbiont of Taylorina sp.]|nr:hypothetical protein [gamma proteobacterium symbiont of Taylorina sp.]